MYIEFGWSIQFHSIQFSRIINFFLVPFLFLLFCVPSFSTTPFLFFSFFLSSFFRICSWQKIKISITTSDRRPTTSNDDNSVVGCWCWLVPLFSFSLSRFSFLVPLLSQKKKRNKKKIESAIIILQYKSQSTLPIRFFHH